MKSSSAPQTLLLSVMMAAGCGGRESAASKSAAEFDREQQKGGAAPATGGAHGGHAAGQEPAADGAEAKDGEGMAGMDHSNMPGIKPASNAAAPARDPMAGMDHSNMSGMKPAKGAPAAGGSMAGMDHSNMPGMDHSNMAGTTMAPPLPEKASASAQPGQPAATLNPGALDGPAPTSVRDAARSAELAQAMAGGHGMTHGTYSQTDAGRTATTAPPPDAMDHGKHGQPAPPRPQPSPGAKENKE